MEGFGPTVNESRAHENGVHDCRKDACAFWTHYVIGEKKGEGCAVKVSAVSQNTTMYILHSKINSDGVLT